VDGSTEIQPMDLIDTLHDKKQPFIAAVVHREDIPIASTQEQASGETAVETPSKKRVTFEEELLSHLEAQKEAHWKILQK